LSGNEEEIEKFSHFSRTDISKGKLVYPFKICLNSRTCACGHPPSQNKSYQLPLFKSAITFDKKALLTSLGKGHGNFAS